MTTTDNSSEVLKRRAERLRRSADEVGLRRLVVQVALVAIGDERLGIPAQGVRAVVAVPQITPLRGLPTFMRGITQIRGEVLTAVDVASWFEIRTMQEPQCMILVEHDRRILGLLADRLVGFRDIYEDELTHELSQERSEANRPVAMFTRDLVHVLDLQQLMNREELYVRRAG